jgi:hypothetical protein
VRSVATLPLVVLSCWAGATVRAVTRVSAGLTRRLSKPLMWGLVMTEERPNPLRYFFGSASQRLIPPRPQTSNPRVEPPGWVILAAAAMHPPAAILAFVLAASLAVTACSTAGRPREALDPLPPAAVLAREPDRYRNHVFAFAGEIVALLQTGDRTLIEMELVAIDQRGRPRTPRRSGGRVFLRTTKPLSADDYLPGRGIIGMVRFIGLAEAVVAGETSTFPLLDLLEHRLEHGLSGGGRPRFEFGLGFGL